MRKRFSRVVTELIHVSSSRYSANIRRVQHVTPIVQSMKSIDRTKSDMFHEHIDAVKKYRQTAKNCQLSLSVYTEAIYK